jgi:hypothetical protein
MNGNKTVTDRLSFSLYFQFLSSQQNAYPTKFRINFDMYTSTVYGESGVTLTMALETCQTMDGKVPKVKIDLVIDP